MTHTLRALTIALASAVASLAVVTLLAQSPAPPPAQPASQQTSVGIVISGPTGGQPRYAVPVFMALSQDAETQAVAKTISEVLWNDLAFEQEFYMIPRDTYASIPTAASFDAIPFDRWRELGADAVVIGSVQKGAGGIRVEARLFGVVQRRQVFAREYNGSAANPRLFAHTISDEIHQDQRGLKGVARTKLTFSSDRDGERIPGPIESRQIKEIYICDYDGENQRRITVNKALNITPVWSADSRSIAYTSFRKGYPDIFISNIYQGTLENPTSGSTGQNWLPVFSPDGTRIAFGSTRDGNPEIYVMNRDGSSLRRLTNQPGSDTTPTWSPTGAEIAFTSDRSGTPQIYVIGADGTGLRRVSSEGYADRATWSPPPFNEIAFAARSGPGFDIKVLDLASGETKQITFGEGSNESPRFSSNGRHIVFTSTRAGKTHLFTIGRDGKFPRQVTKAGNNFTPDWSR